jgi:hypothetical protein
VIPNGGTVNILVFLVVHTGQMEAVIVDKKDAAHYVQELERFRQRHRGLKGVFLIQDGDPSHTAGDTGNYFANFAYLVASTRYSSTRLVAQSSGDSDPSLQPLLPEAPILAQS